MEEKILRIIQEAAEEARDFDPGEDGFSMRARCRYFVQALTRDLQNAEHQETADVVWSLIEAHEEG